MKEQSDVDLMPLLVEFHSMQKGGCLGLLLSILPPLSFKRLYVVDQIASALEFTSKEVFGLIFHATQCASGSQTLDEGIQKINAFYEDMLENNSKIKLRMAYLELLGKESDALSAINKAQALEIDSACAWWVVFRK